MKYLFTLVAVALFSFSLSAQNALRFDGANDYIQAALPGPTGDASRTVEAWINIPSYSSTQKVILDYGDMSNGSRFTLNIINGIPRIEVGGSGFSAPSAISLNTWHHIAASFSNIGNPQVRLFVDGVAANAGNFSVPVYTSAANGIIIGRRNDATNYFLGLIDEVRVWDDILTQGTIVANMNHEFCTSVPNLINYYTFNQGVAGQPNPTVTTLTDFSGNNPGTLYNFALTGTTSNWVTGKPLSGNTTATVSPVTCSSYTSPSGLYTYTTTGTYHDTVPNAFGCDSIITINLTVNAADTSVLQIGAALQSNQGSGVYQWLDCNNGYAVVPGATTQTFFPAVNGSYAVQVTANGCTDTSGCRNVTNVSVSEITSGFTFNVYPNPVTDGVVHLNYDGSQLQNITFVIYNVQGQVLSRFPADAKNHTISFVLPAGVYFVKIDGGVAVRKLVVY